MTIIILYILGALIHSWFMCTWFFTALPLHLFKPFIASEMEVDTWEDWNNWLMCKNSFIAELLGCPLCLGFWVALGVSTIIAWVNGLALPFVFAGWFSWPLISFIVHRKLEK